MATQTSADTAQQTPNLRMQWKPIAIAIGAAVCFSALAYWGGMPPADQVPKFLLGVAVMLAVSGVIGYLTWHFLLRPMPGLFVPKGGLLTGIQRYVLGVVLMLAIVVEAVGSVWDETWHVKYGIPFGPDFFWRPHLMIYAGLLTILIACILAWVLLNVRAKGTMMQRFRAEPLVGGLALMALVLAYALPADPIWHSIYGNDLSAFSIPHVVLEVLVLSALLIGVTFLLSSVPDHAWRSVRALTTHDLLPLLAFATLESFLVLLLTADWFDISAEDVAAGTSRILLRPEWLPFLFIVAIGTCLGVMVVRALRCYGTATLVGITSSALRFVLVYWLGHPDPNANMWLFILPPMVAVDLVLYFLARRKQTTPGQESRSILIVGLGAALATAVFTLPLYNRFMIYPQITLSNLLPILLVLVLTAMAAAWVGMTIGDFMAVQAETHASVSSEIPAWRRWFAPGALVICAVFVILFVLTATPPVS